MAIRIGCVVAKTIRKGVFAMVKVGVKSAALMPKLGTSGFYPLFTSTLAI